MFDFQKEVILNNLDNVEVFDDKGIRVDGMLYKKEYIQPVYETAPEDAEKARLGIDLNAVNTAATTEGSIRHVQFVLELGLDNDYRGDFGSALYYFRKPVVVNLDVDTLTDTDTVVKAFKKASVSDEKLFTVVTKGTDMVAGASLTLVMNDCYITVRKAEAVGYYCADSCNGEGMEQPVLLKDLKNAKIGESGSEKPAYISNVIGFGTYDYMIHNLRLPTNANWRFTSPAASEMPRVGGKYTQYSFEYTVPRRLGGLSVAGQKTASTTIHTFFVLNDETKNGKNFKALLQSAGATVVTVLNENNPYVEYEDHDEAAPIVHKGE